MQLPNKAVSLNTTFYFTGSSDLEDEVKVLEDYVVGQRLGEGAYGSVYAVKYIPSGDRFALKILQKQDLFSSTGLSGFGNFDASGTVSSQAENNSGALRAAGPLGADPSFMAATLVKSFEAQIISEAMVMQSLEHPHVAKLYKFLNSTTSFYFVMELAEGGELFDLILSKKYFAEDEARVYFQQLISAIDYCHRNGVAHKDLKAENLLLSSDNRLLVCDFGFSSKIAKENIDDPEETVGTGDNIALLDTANSGGFFGTLHYTSPEAVRASEQSIPFAATYASGPVFTDSETDARNARLLDPDRRASASTVSSSYSSSFSPSRSSASPASSRNASIARDPFQRVKDIFSGTKSSPAPAVMSVTTSDEVFTGQKSASHGGRGLPSSSTSPLPANEGGPSFHRVGSARSLSSTTNSHKQKKGPSNSGLNRVGEGFSNFVKSLMSGSSGHGAGHHHQYGEREGRVQGSRAASPQEKQGPAFVAPIAGEGRADITLPRGNACLSGMEQEECTSESQQQLPSRSLRAFVPSQEHISLLSSGVSSSMSSPTTVPSAKPAFAELASGRAAGASSTTPEMRPDPATPSSSSPIFSSPVTSMIRRSHPGGKDALVTLNPTADGVCSLAAATLCKAPKESSRLPLPLPESSAPVTAALKPANSPLPPHHHRHHHRHHQHHPRAGDRRSGPSDMLDTSTPARKTQSIFVDPFQQDLWSAGVILFFMLTGRLPFDGHDDEETLHQIEEGEFSFNEEEMHRISPAARKLVTQMLASDPMDRPTAEQIIANPWFRRNIQIEKDFPHREDLKEAHRCAAAELSKRPPLLLRAGDATGMDRNGRVVSNGGHGSKASERWSASRDVSCSMGSNQTSFPGGGGGGVTLPLNHVISDARTPVTSVPSFVPASGDVSLPSGSLHDSLGSNRKDDFFVSTTPDCSIQRPVTPEEERLLETAFRKIDSDGFGCITRDQVRDMLTTLHGEAVLSEDVDELMRLFTGDAHAEHITFREFRDAWVNKDLANIPFTHNNEFQLCNIVGTEMDAVEREVVQQLRTAFDSLDEKHGGVIQLYQMQRVFKECNFDVQTDECLSLMKYFHEMEVARLKERASLQRQRRGGPAAALHPLNPLGAESQPGFLRHSSVSSPSQAADPPTASSAITISFDSFVCGIVKNDILLKHPLGRKLAAATNLAALFQSRNVTECVRHGFLVVGLQNVILVKLTSTPERLRLLYSDEVVSSTENVYSFRYLGSSALLAGTTMKAATPLLMSSSLVAMAASLGPASTAAPSACQGSASSPRFSPTTSVSTALPLQGGRSSAAMTNADSGSGFGRSPLLLKGASTATDSSKGFRAGKASSLPKNPTSSLDHSAGQSRTSITQAPAPSHARGLPGPSSASSSDFLSQPDKDSNGMYASHMEKSSAVRLSPCLRRSSMTIAPKHAVPFVKDDTVAASLSRSLAVSCLSNSTERSPTSHRRRNKSRGGSPMLTRAFRDAGCNSDDAHDDTESFFSSSRNSSSIVNTSDESHSNGSGGVISLELGEDIRRAAAAAKAANHDRSAAKREVDTAEVNVHANKAASTNNSNSTHCTRTHTDPTTSASARASGNSLMTHGKHKKSPKTSSLMKETPISLKRSGAVAAPISGTVHRSSSKTAATLPPSNESCSSPKRIVRTGATDNLKPIVTASSVPPKPALPQAQGSLTSPHSLLSASHSGTGAAFQFSPSATFSHRAMTYGGTGAVAQVNGVCDVDIILSPACLGYTMVHFRRIHGKTSDFHEAVIYISNLLELERDQAMEDTMTRGESELM